MHRLIVCGGCLVHHCRNLDIQRNTRFFHVMRIVLKQNHYQVLGITPKANPKDIRDAYVKISKEVHPDRNPDDPENHNKFVLVHKAYSVLKQPHRRSQYDARLLRGVHMDSDRPRWQEYQTPSRQPSHPRTGSYDYESYEYHTNYWKEYHKRHGNDTQTKNKVPGVVVCLITLGSGFVYFYVAYAYSRIKVAQYERRNRENQQLYEKSKANSMNHEQTREYLLTKIKHEEQRSSMSSK